MSAIDEINQYLDNILEKTGTFYLGTVDGDKPSLRPVSFKMTRDNKLYLGVGTFKKVYAQLQANPNLVVVGCAGPNWIRINAKAVFDTSEAAVAQAFEEAPYLKGIYNEESGLTMGLFYLAEGTATTYTSMMNEDKTYQF